MKQRESFDPTLIYIIIAIYIQKSEATPVRALVSRNFTAGAAFLPSFPPSFLPSFPPPVLTTLQRGRLFLSPLQKDEVIDGRLIFTNVL